MSSEVATTSQPSRFAERGIQITDGQQLIDFARRVHASRLAPSSFTSPDQVAIAIQMGLELGMPPLSALKSIAVINNRPSLWGDALPGLCRRSGAVEFIRESIEGEGDERVAVCHAKRSDTKEENAVRFSVADAKTAKLWGKSGPWTSYPERMLQMRARSWCLRDLFADALMGVYIAEEVQDYEPREPEYEERPVSEVLPPNESEDANPADVKAKVDELFATESDDAIPAYTEEDAR